jgi:hypothetical protein
MGASTACDRPAPAPASSPIDAGNEPGTIAVTVDGKTATVLAPSALAKRPARWRTRGRRAWSLGDVLGEPYAVPEMHVAARTAHGAEHRLRGGGQPGTDVILVQRDDRSLYIGWLKPRAEQYGDELGDAEQPMQRIEDVVELVLSRPKPPPELPPAVLSLVRAGAAEESLTTETFATAATLIVRLPDGSTIPAMPIDGVVRVVADGGEVVVSPPVAGSRPAIRLNKRKRFKLVWVDDSGLLLTGGGVREVSRVYLE